MRTLLLSAAIGAAILFAGAGSAATTHMLTLNAVNDNPSITEQDFNSYHFTQFSWDLTGFDQPIDVVEGDTINATVTLKPAYTIPASTGFTDYGLYLFGPDLPDQPTATGNGVYSLYLAGGLITTMYAGSSTSSGIAAGGGLFPPNSGELTFDSYTLSFDVITLETPVTLDGATLTVSVADQISAVPELGTWAMMLIGFGGVGAAMRRRQAVTVRFA